MHFHVNDPRSWAGNQRSRQARKEKQDKIGWIKNILSKVDKNIVFPKPLYGKHKLKGQIISAIKVFFRVE